VYTRRCAIQIDDLYLFFSLPASQDFPVLSFIPRPTHATHYRCTGAVLEKVFDFVQVKPADDSVDVADAGVVVDVKR